MDGQTHAFQADVARLLDLMVHSVYSERDIFLRELISNAADACEKLRHEALLDPSLGSDRPALITVALDKPNRTLTVTDNGIGMSEEELVTALGTIARSGTRAFLNRLQANAKENETVGADLIGQFGIGFYSAFMVASEIDVASRRAGTSEAHLWRSDGKGSFSVVSVPVDEAPAPGTRVVLHLNESSDDYLEPHRVEKILRDYSSAIAVPVDLVEAPDAAPRRITDGAALWNKPKSAVTEEEYTEFYRNLAGQFDEPALTMHWRAEGRHEYSVLAFLPGSRPFDLFDPARRGRGKLYVRHVLIAQDAEILPGWLRFIRLVVDSADLPLNVSREMIQESAVYAAIKKGVANRIVQDLVKLAESDAGAYAKVWENFGAVMKEGLYEDPERRDALFKLARFATTRALEGKRSLADYVASIRPNQTAIYYLLGEDVKRLNVSPQLEGFRSRGIEVLLLSDPIDAFWVSTAAGFDGKPFKSVSQGAADIAAIAPEEGKEAPPAAPPSAQLASLMALMKQELTDVVEDVRASDRLSKSPACLIASERGLDRRLERLLAEHGQLGSVSKPVLEINPTHPLVMALAEKIGQATPSALGDVIWLLFDEARLMDGERPQDASSFATRLTRVLLKALSEPTA
ncbi:MAG: molecular chaperone HtpG [Methylovirgula sp.]|jgi:molecular chaperone HtpG